MLHHGPENSEIQKFANNYLIFSIIILDSYVAIANVLGAYLSIEINGLVLMVLRGELTELINLIDPTLYSKYVVIGSSSKPILLCQATEISIRVHQGSTGFF